MGEKLYRGGEVGRMHDVCQATSQSMSQARQFGLLRKERGSTKVYGFMYVDNIAPPQTERTAFVLLTPWCE